MTEAEFQYTVIGLLAMIACHTSKSWLGAVWAVAAMLAFLKAAGWL